MAAKKQKSDKKSQGRKYRIATKDRVFLISNLAIVMKSGVSIGEALSSMARSVKSASFKAALLQASADIDDGISLWKALDRAGMIKNQTKALIQLGESSGNLPQNLKVAAEQEEKQQLFRSKVRSAMMYPSFVLIMTLIVGVAVAWFLLPQLSETFSQLDAELPVFSKLLIDLGVFLQKNGLWAVPTLFVGLFGLIYFLFAFGPTKRLGNELLFKIPGVSRLLVEVEIARFGYLLGTLLEAGLSVTEALKLLLQSTGAQRYKKFYKYLLNSFDEGYGFSEGFKKYEMTDKLLPTSVQQIVIAGEKSGSLADSLKDVGKNYEEKADISTQNLEVIIEPMLLFLVAGGVMGVAIAVIVPIYQLIGNLD